MLVRRRGFAMRFPACSLVLLLSLFAGPLLGQIERLSLAQGQPKNILLLYSYGHGGEGIGVFDEGLLGALDAGGINTNNLFFEYLDLERNNADSEHKALLKSELARRYARHRIDLILTIQQPALNFLLDEGKELAPGIPVIALQAPLPAVRDAGKRRVLGLVASFDIKGTLERALKLFPDTRRVVFVSGNSEADQRMASAAAKVASAWTGKLEFEYTSELPLDQMLKRVGSLPQNSIIIFTQYNRDTTGRVTVAYEVEGMIVKAANAPVFGLYDFNLRNGGIGGSVVGVKDLGERTGRLALDVLSGKTRVSQPVASLDVKVIPMFDWTQIKRWGSDPYRLPPDTVFVNRVPTMWEQYAGTLIWVALLIVAQFLLIGALVVGSRRRRMIEESLRESESRLRFHTNNSPLAIVEWDASFVVTRWAGAAEKIFGWRPEEVIGKPIMDLQMIYEEDVPLVQETMRKFSDGVTKNVVSKNRNYTKDRKVIFCEWYNSVRNDGRGRMISVMSEVLDITERRRSEEALKESEARLRDITFSVGDWVWEVDQNTVYTYSSQRGFDFFGPAPESIIGKTPFDLMPPDEAKRVAAIFAEIAANKAPIKDLENWNIRSDGELVCLLTNGVPVLDEAGNLKGYRGVDKDITERKRLEKEKAALEQQFQQVQKMDSVGRLAGGVAHDFNNMLTVIRGNVAFALERVDSTQPIHTDLVEIRKAADRSADLTGQLLAFARKQVVAPKVLNLNDTVVGTIKMLQRLIGEDISLKWLPGENLWLANVDPSQIDQILANLCINARDAISGVGNIVIETGNSTLDEEYCATHAGFVPGDYVRISVSDNGHGIDKETLPNIFEPFFTTKGLGEGTGLGLATVYGAVKQNNGFINVYSEPGTGTTLTIYLPRHSGGPEAAREPGTAGQAVSGKETVLLVEDEPAILKLTERILARAGYAVLPAKSPGEAMRLAGEHAGPIHLLITDVVMPEMNGRDLAKNLLSLCPGLKLLFMSGYTANIIVHQGVLDHGVQFIQKPFSIEDITAKVREVLNSE